MLGIEGWRFAFLTVAATSWAMGLATCLLGVDPRYTSDGRYRCGRGCARATNACLMQGLGRRKSLGWWLGEAGGMVL